MRFILIVLSFLTLFGCKSQSFSLSDNSFKTGFVYTTWSIAFGFDNSQLNIELSKPSLDSILTFLNANKNSKVEVGVHSISRGTAEYNKKQSAERAEALKNYFVTAGIDANRLTAFGYGNTKPIAEVKTKITDQDPTKHGDRRVTIKILSK